MQIACRNAVRLKKKMHFFTDAPEARGSGTDGVALTYHYAGPKARLRVQVLVLFGVHNPRSTTVEVGSGDTALGVVRACDGQRGFVVGGGHDDGVERVIGLAEEVNNEIVHNHSEMGFGFTIYIAKSVPGRKLAEAKGRGHS